MEFSNPATKTGFTILVKKDRNVHVPATDKHGAYYGPLSRITPQVAETMLSQGCDTLEKNSTHASPAANNTSPKASASKAD